MLTADGMDLSALLRGESNEGKRVGVTEFAWSKSLRKGDWRYVFYPREMFPAEYPDGFGELYNLADDPWEMHNLYFAPEYQRIVQELKAELLDWLVASARTATVHGANNGLPPADPQYIGRYHTWAARDGKIGRREIRPRAREAWKRNCI